MSIQVLISMTAILRPWKAVISVESSCCPWSSNRFHRTHSHSTADSVGIFLVELGRIRAKGMAKPTVMTPSTKNSCED